MATRNRTSTLSEGRRIGRRLLLGAGVLLVLGFAIEGGEYGTWDLASQRDRHAAMIAEVAALRADVDSLKVELKAVTTDRSRIERVARERYGMVKGDKEILYFTRGARIPGDSAVRADSTDG